MNRSRRLFVADAAGSAVALMLGGCGGGDYSPAPPSPPPMPVPPPPPPTPAFSCGATNISENHGHTLAIPPADEDSTVDKVYPITGAADHIHYGDAHRSAIRAIKAKTAVTVRSGLASACGHTHTVTVNCA